ncbi:MAG: hypothetical protein V4690_04025 [Patescibacteria group bacterium]
MSQRDKSDDALTIVSHIEDAIRFNETMLESFHDRINRLQLMLVKNKGAWHEAAIRAAIEATESEIILFSKDLGELHLRLDKELNGWAETLATPTETQEQGTQKPSKILKYRRKVH